MNSKSFKRSSSLFWGAGRTVPNSRRKLMHRSYTRLTAMKNLSSWKLMTRLSIYEGTRRVFKRTSLTMRLKNSRCLLSILRLPQFLRQSPSMTTTRVETAPLKTRANDSNPVKLNSKKKLRIGTIMLQRLTLAYISPRRRTWVLKSSRRVERARTTTTTERLARITIPSTRIWKTFTMMSNFSRVMTRFWRPTGPVVEFLSKFYLYFIYQFQNN